jgi:hypothetical protein
MNVQVMAMKKTEYITFRTDAATKEALSEYASEKKWSISLLVEDIVQEWIKKQTPPDNH